jgi:hypothetical protein
MLLATIANFFFAVNISLGLISPTADSEHDLPGRLCNSLLAVSSSSSGRPTLSLPVDTVMQDILESLDEASDFFRQGCNCSSSCETITPFLIATDFAARSASRALFAYTARLSPSLNVYVNTLRFHAWTCALTIAFRILATACSSLNMVERPPSFKQRLCASLRDLTGYHCVAADYRDTQHYMIESTNEVLQRSIVKLSQLHNKLARTLAILDSHTRTLGRLISDSLGDTLWGYGGAGNNHKILGKNDTLKEQDQALALFLVRDVRSLITRLQLDLSFFDAASNVMGLFDTSSYAFPRPAREILRTLIIKCYTIRTGLMGRN